MKTLLTLTSALLLTAAFVGCSSETENSTTGETAIVSHPSNKGTVTLDKGETLKVALAGNPSTGYIWQRISGDNSVLAQQGDYVFTPAAEAIGSPGQSTFSFFALNSGEEQLTFIYSRPFEKNKAPAETFTINVKVK